MHVLLVEDSAPSAIAETLRRQGLIVTTVPGIGRASIALENHLSAVIVSLGGAAADDESLKLLRELCQQFPETPILTICAEGNPALLQRARNDGAQECLVAGQFDDAQLLEAVHYATERKSIECRLSRLSSHDPLTGVWNRRRFDTTLAESSRRALHTNHFVGMLYIGLDGFKPINDTYGNDCGDAVLREVARRLEGCVRNTDIVCRLGGDEFGILLTELAAPEDADVVAQRVSAAFEHPVRTHRFEAMVGVRLGVAIHSAAGTEPLDPGALIERAAASLFPRTEAPASIVDEPSGVHPLSQLVKSQPQRPFGIAELRRAFDAGEFCLYFQPEVNEHGALAAMEALLRWKRPDGVLPAGAFIGQIEKSDWMRELGRWVIRQACAEAAAFRAVGIWAPVAINISASELADESLVTDVAHALLEHRLPGQAIEIEITETAAVEDLHRGRAVLSELSRLGIRIALDDFGTGYASLASLRNLPANKLKIDRSFVRGMANVKQDAAIVSMIVALGAALDLDVVAEGVESHTEADALIAQGCDMLQGYHIAMPMPRAAVVAWVAERTHRKAS